MINTEEAHEPFIQVLTDLKGHRVEKKWKPARETVCTYSFPTEHAAKLFACLYGGRDLSARPTNKNRYLVILYR